MKTPDQIVGDNIATSLLESKLISEEDAKSLSSRLARGEIKDSDWLMLIRMGIPKTDGQEGDSIL